MKLLSRGTAAVIVGIAAIGSTIAIWSSLTHPTGVPVAAPDATDAQRVHFSDETLALGAVAEHRQGDDHLTGLDEALGSGACALDYDNDGWMDLFVVNGSGDTRYYGRRHWWQRAAGHVLLHNRGAAHFEDVSATALNAHPMRGFGCVAADFDNDGYTDVFITGFGENMMLRNLGNGRFMDVTEQAGLKGYGWQTAVAVADVDGDGLLDLYVGRFIAFEKGAHTYEPGSQYKQDVPASFNPALYPAQAKSLYRNLGGFRFEDVAEKAGVADADGRTLGALWLDFDGDGRPDLIVANAPGTGSNAVFHNEGKWHFRALGAETRLQTAAGARAATLTDLDNDGVPELLVTATNGSQSAIFVRQGSPTSDRPEFIDRARQWHFASDEYSGFSPWSAIAADFDNDGWLDVFVANGLAIPDQDVPRVTVGQPKQLYLNSRHGSLQAQRLPAMDPLLDRQSARGAVAADFDNDGAMDLYVTHNNDLGQLLMNRARGPHWVGLRLVDTHGNRDAIGARVELSGAEGEQYRWVTQSAGFLSGSDPRVHFGLGQSPIIDRVVVTWPDGDRSTFRDLPADQYVVLTRGSKPRTVTPPAYTGTGGNYATLARGGEAALRADYVRLLVEANGLDASMDALRDALTDRDVSVRKASVELLAARPTSASLAALLDSLSDPDPEIVASGAKAVCTYEEEAAVRWLLRLFAHRSALVRTAVADCFSSYFYKEQGGVVMHRKYLSVPYLVEALADSDEHVQIAAARALGNAERFRGVPPLLELTRSTGSRAVRAEAVRATGLIRDKQATAGLIGLLDDERVRNEPATLAQLLVALKRLDYSSLDVALTEFSAGSGKFARVPLRVRLGAMQELLRSEDGVVIPREDVSAFARRSAERAAAADEASMLMLIDVLREGRSLQSIPLLTSLSTSGKTAALRAAALNALIAADPAKAAAYVERSIDAGDAEVTRRLLEALSGTRVDISDRALLVALKREETRAGVLSVVRRVRDKAAADTIFAIAADRNTAPKMRAAALEALSRSSFKYTVPAEVYAGADEPVALALVKYEMSQLPPLYVSREAPPVVDRLLAIRSEAVRLATIDALAQRREFWAKARILALLKGSADAGLRSHVIELISRDALEGSQILEVIATDKMDPLRIEALRHLEGREGSSAEQLLLSVLHDATEDPHARIVAAHRLVGRIGPDVLKILAGTS